MGLIITNAILHTVTNHPETFRLSNAELDIDSETCTEFVSRHVRRLMGNPAAKEATFTAGSAVHDMVKSYQKGDLRFRDLSCRLCERLASILQANEDIPPADILVAAFGNSGKDYLAVIKLNYGECFTHRLVDTDRGPVNEIIKNTAVLPLSTGKIEEACLIPYDPMILRILEKPHTVDGEDTCYFSKLFLECETEAVSKKEAADTIRAIAGELNEKYFEGSVETEARIKCALIEETELLSEDEGLVLDNVARRAFPENEEAKTEFIAKAKESGLPFEVKLDKPFVQREFKMQRFKADNGIELKCPSDLFQDPDTMQLTANPDGSVTILLKNLRRQDAQ